MAINKTGSHIIAYDIANPKRLARIHRYLRKIAMPIQYSVFLIQCTPSMLKAVRDELEEMMNTAEDDIRIYSLPIKQNIMTLGQQHMKEGIYLLGGEHDRYISEL